MGLKSLIEKLEDCEWELNPTMPLNVYLNTRYHQIAISCRCGKATVLSEEIGLLW